MDRTLSEKTGHKKHPSTPHAALPRWGNRKCATGRHEPLPAAMCRTTLTGLLLLGLTAVLMATKHTRMMRASMTAYSTAVGPSSAHRNRRTGFRHLAMDPTLSEWSGAVIPAWSPRHHPPKRRAFAAYRARPGPDGPRLAPPC